MRGVLLTKFQVFLFKGNNTLQRDFTVGVDFIIFLNLTKFWGH